MTERVSVQRLQVAANLKRFIEEEALPGSGVDAAAFWSGFDALVHDLAPKNAALLAERDRIQAEIDACFAQLTPRQIEDIKFAQAQVRNFAEHQKAALKDVEVEITFDPPWSKDLMSEEAKLELGML